MKTESRTARLVDAFYSEKVLNLDAMKEILAQLPHFSDQNLFKSMGYDIV